MSVKPNVEFKYFGLWYLYNKWIIISTILNQFSIRNLFYIFTVEYKFKIKMLLMINSYNSVLNSNALPHLAATEINKEHHHKNYQLFKIK